MSPEAAQILAVWIFLGNLGGDRRLAKPVRPIGRAVWSAQCPEVLQGAATIPKEGMLRATWNQVRRTTHPARAADVKPGAVRSLTQHAEIGDGVAVRVLDMVLLCLLCDDRDGYRQES